MAIVIRLILAVGGAAGLYKTLRSPGDALKENAVPLALVAAGTFLAFRAMQKAKVA